MELFSNIDSFGTKRWWKELGVLHREDGPAVEHKDGSVAWYQNGKMHKENGPALEGADGKKEWAVNGKLHRKDGPAIIWPDGTKNWFINGKLHREDGPAIEWPGGTKMWFFNGKPCKENEINMPRHFTKDTVPEPFTPHPDDKVKMVSSTWVEKNGSQIPEIILVKRNKLDYFRSIGWMTLADFHRKKYWERQNLLDSYDKMFKHLEEKS